MLLFVMKPDLDDRNEQPESVAVSISAATAVSTWTR
jgi:hypothetical protein